MGPKKLFAILLSIALLGVGCVFATAYTQNTTTLNSADSISEKSENDLFAKYAKISEGKARSIVLSKVPGKVVKISLENEDGHIVYSIEISTSNGKLLKDVKVNAKNGKILKIDEVDEKENDKEINDNYEKSDKEINNDNTDNDKETNDDNIQDAETH